MIDLILIINKLQIKFNILLFLLSPFLFQIMLAGPITLIPVLVKSIIRRKLTK